MFRLGTKDFMGPSYFETSSTNANCHLGKIAEKIEYSFSVGNDIKKSTYRKIELVWQIESKRP